jgi:NADH:ubiquinone oxidoreductase subunit K
MAPRKSTLTIAAVLYIIGLFGLLRFFNIPLEFSAALLAVAGGLLILAALFRGL